MAWYDPNRLYRQKITIDHTLVAEELTDFPVLITHAVTHASLFAHARSDGADIVVTAGHETTRLKRELVTYDAIAGELELYVRIPSLSSLTDTEVYVYYGNAGATEANDADTWNADYGVVYHLEEDPRRHAAAGEGQHCQCGARAPRTRPPLTSVKNPGEATKGGCGARNRSFRCNGTWQGGVSSSFE